ncbi:MAG: LexA family transcriptional regulator [Fusobacteriaceae bacterium]
MKRKKITGLELSKLCDISPQYFTNIKKGRKIPTFKLLNQMLSNLSLLDWEKEEVIEIWKKAKDPEYSIGIKKNECEIIEVPLVGKVSAGRGYLNFESSGNSIPFINSSRLDYSKCFAMTVEGDSMEPKIRDGSDIVVDPAVNNLESNLNKIVVADLNEETYVKILKLVDNRLCLQSINPDYPDIPVRKSDSLRVVGKVVEIRYQEFVK